MKWKTGAAVLLLVIALWGCALPGSTPAVTEPTAAPTIISPATPALLLPAATSQTVPVVTSVLEKQVIQQLRRWTGRW